MSLFPSRTILLQLGPLTITWYAFFIITGALLALYLSKQNLKKYKNKKTSQLPAGLLTLKREYLFCI